MRHTHNDIVARLGPRGFQAVRGTRDAVRPKPTAVRGGSGHLDAAALSRGIRNGVASGFARSGVAAATAGMKASAEAASASLSRLADCTARLTQAVEAYKAKRQAMADAAAAPSGLMSATSGYIRDSDGNRIRPMTPADLNAIADKHYSRTRP